MKKLSLLATLLCSSIILFAQDNFTYTPEKPKPGDEISFNYTQSGDLAGIMKMPEAFVLVFENKNGSRIVDIPLKREYGKLTGKFKTDTSARTVAFGFTIDDKIDNNGNKGYIIQLYKDDKPLEKSFSDVAVIYSSLGEWKLGMKTDQQKAMKVYEDLFKLYPDSRNDNIVNYLYALNTDNKDKGNIAIQKEIENSLKTGLKAEKDYDKLISLYNILRLRQQGAFIKKLKDEKFPSVKKDDVNTFYGKFMAAPDIEKKENILQDVLTAAKTAENKDEYQSFISYLQRNIAGAYAAKKDWDGFKKITSTITDERTKANLYNSTAWQMQEDSTNLKLAEELSRYTVEHGKADWKKPKGEKPAMQRYNEWMKQKESDYATYADTYAMILYRMDNYKKALSYTNEAANTITKGQNADLNKTYALIAEKALPVKKYKSQLEQYVKDGKSNAEIEGILKRTYIKEKGSDTGFDIYLAALTKDAYEKMLADLKKEMLNEKSSQFTLKDLQGNTVSLADFKNKVVIVDFWATWCGPCIASMPGMQKMVEKYKDDSSVKFLFIDTWQNEENEIENAAKFIKEKNYAAFHVLMDLDDKVVSDYKVDGIPTKFIIGKDGNIKFKEIGFDGEDNLLKKLPAMIELAN